MYSTLIHSFDDLYNYTHFYKNLVFTDKNKQPIHVYTCTCSTIKMSLFSFLEGVVVFWSDWMVGSSKNLTV